MTRRAALCVPATEPAKIVKALRLPVDEVVVDLEDAIAVDRKAEARTQIGLLDTWEHGSLAVRVNGVASEWFAADVAACAANPAVGSIVVPKVESPEDLELVDHALATSPLDIQALVESPTGVANAQHIAAASKRLVSLIIGYADLAASTGRRPESSWQFVQDAVLLAARVSGIQAIDGPYLGVEADQSFEDLLTNVEAMGFDGKWIIHPRQVEATQRVFTPDDGEIAEAREILATMDQASRTGDGAVQWRGRMLDEAVAAAARRVLARGGAA